MNYPGITIDGKHTSEFGLKMTSMYIPQPEPKISRISIPGASGSIDLSEITGEIHYEDREGLQFEFDLMDESYEAWAIATSEISMWIHGKKVKVVLDNDPGYYYLCRLNVDSKKDNPVLSKITLKGTADPFKYDVQATDEDWLWDPFNFETGTILELSGLQITADSNEIKVTGMGLPTCPEFIITESTDLALFFEGSTYEMPEIGTYRFPQVKIGGDTATLIFSGTGSLSIRYRRRYL